MIRPAAIAFTAAFLLGALASPAALARPEDGTARIALEGGWRYQPNARFAEWAAINGYQSTGPSSGGPSFIATFGYRPLAELELSIELGFAHEEFGFAGLKPMQFNQVPVGLTLRYAPFAGSLYPYVGLGYGYLLNFFENAPGGEVESHGAGPVALAGVALELDKRISIFAEYRYTYCRVELGNLGYMQAGGKAFFLGVQLALPPEDNHLQ